MALVYDRDGMRIRPPPVLRYLPGILLVQIATVALLLAAGPESDARELALRVALPAAVVALVAALWLASVARADAERRIGDTRLEHERERERLRREAESERERLRTEAERTRESALREASEELRRVERRSNRRADAKVALAFAASGGIGVLFVLSELVMLGLLTLSGVGGAVGGYLLRWRQTRSRARPVAETPSGGAPWLVGETLPSETDAPPPSLPAPEAVADSSVPTSRPGAAGRGATRSIRGDG